MKAFLLNLQAPMMSFGDTGFGQLREAGTAPSRSVVIGAIAAALGIERGDERLVDLHRELRVHVATVIPGTQTTDYHTVSVAGYAEYDPVRLRRAGLPGNPVLTERSYHMDAHFVAQVVTQNHDLAEECVAALQQPVFTGYIGRRSCPPATPLWPTPAEIFGAETAEYEIVQAMLVPAAIEAREKRNKARSKRRAAGLVMVRAYLDGTRESLRIPGTARVLVESTRRDFLIAVPRSYVNRSVLHLDITVLNQPSQDSPNTTEGYFHAAP